MDAPVSLVGGVTTILNIADVCAALDEIERLRRELDSTKAALHNCGQALRGSYDARG